MKRTKLSKILWMTISIYSLGCLFASGEYISMFEPDQILVWKDISIYDPDYVIYTHETFEQFAPIEEDIIGYKYRWHQSDMDNEPFVPDIFNYYYEKDGRVMVWCEAISEFVCMYDFGVKVGDVIENRFRVIGEGKVVSGGMERRAIKIKRLFKEYVHVDDEFLWIEGVGTNDFDNILHHYSPYRLYDIKAYFYGLYKNGQCIFSPEDFDKYVSEVELDVEEVNAESSLSFIPGVYNLQGMKVGDTTDGLPAGFYIINGKKTFVN